MLAKCICTNCAGHLEFEEENAGEKIECPHCGFNTTLFLPGTEPDSEEASETLKSGTLRRRLIWIGGPVLALAAFGYAIHRWVLPPLRDWLPYSESIVLPVILLIFAGLCLLLLLVWLVVPVLVFLQLRKMTRVLWQIETCLRPFPLPVSTSDQAATEEEEPEEVPADEKAAVAPDAPDKQASAAR